MPIEQYNIYIYRRCLHYFTFWNFTGETKNCILLLFVDFLSPFYESCLKRCWWIIMLGYFWGQQSDACQIWFSCLSKYCISEVYKVLTLKPCISTCSDWLRSTILWHNARSCLQFQSHFRNKMKLRCFDMTATICSWFFPWYLSVHIVG